MTNDGPVYHALSVHLSRAKLITRFDDRYAVAKFSKSDFRTKFQREVPLFLEITEFLLTQCRTGEGSSHAKNQLHSFIRFDRTPTCDGQTDTGPWLVLGCIASRGKNVVV